MSLLCNIFRSVPVYISPVGRPRYPLPPAQLPHCAPPPCSQSSAMCSISPLLQLFSGFPLCLLFFLLSSFSFDILLLLFIFFCLTMLSLTLLFLCVLVLLCCRRASLFLFFLSFFLLQPAYSLLCCRSFVISWSKEIICQIISLSATPKCIPPGQGWGMFVSSSWSQGSRQLPHILYGGVLCFVCLCLHFTSNA